MAFLKIENIRVSGISACVPEHKLSVSDYPLFSEDEAAKFISTTGVEQRRIAPAGVTSSDLCFEAAQKLLYDMKWDKSDIDILIFVSQTRDYILPSTSCILQDRLRLSTECYTMDIPYGCSGYVYGLSVIASLMSNGNFRKGLLLSGDVILPHHNFEDKTSYPLFSDSGTATALEYDKHNEGFKFHFGTDGSGYKAIMIPDGGYRNRVTEKSFELVDYGIDGKRTNLDCYLNGMDVFAFGISRAPESVKKLCEHFQIDLENIDKFVMHQANLFMNEKIRKKLKISEEKVPYSLKDFGNTSCASIPLTMVTQLKNELEIKSLSHIACGFGVGLSWGSVYFETDNIVCSELIEI